MDDQVGEDDGYSDDDLDALPDNALHKLQEDAFRSTQQQGGSLQPPLPEIQRTAPPEIVGGFGRLSVGGSTAAHQKGPQEPSSDYGDFDDEMLDGEIFDGAEQPAHANTYDRARSAVPIGLSTQREQWRLERYGAPLHQKPVYGAQHHNASQQLHRSLSSANNEPSRDNAVSPRQELQDPSEGPAEGTADVESLQAQVQRLLREREALQKAVRNANDNAYAKTGEIAIVRANILKVEQESESRTKALQKLHADEAARHRIEVEKVRAENQRIATEKEFLKNDLAEDTKRLRQLQKTIKQGNDTTAASKVLEKESILTTPKKNRNLPYGDGFSDDEAQVLSPSRLALRSKASTPKAGAKRKRKTTEGSPAKPLELAQPPRDESFDVLMQDEAPTSKPVTSNPNQTHSDRKFRFTQKLLNHRIERGQERTIEALSNFRLPSQPDKALSTILYDKILMLGGGSVSENLPAAVGLIIISLWSQCLKEHYHDPVHLLIDLIGYIMLLTPLKTAPELTNNLMELVQETADIIIIPRVQKKPPRTDSAHIASISCLRVIHMVAQDCSIETEEITRFWRTIRFDFIMMLLSFIHPLEEIHITIALLQTSILGSSFAMIIPPGDGKQDATEARVIDNLSRLLVESPRPAQGEPALDAVPLSELRLEILCLMDAMCERTHAAEALAKHRLVIGRLVRVMNDELDRAYDYQYGHEQRIALVNTATRLLYLLTSKYTSLIDMQAKLSVIPGGEKKFLIALTRLAFSEGGLLEGGIEDEVVDKAHQMLEMRVSPEEADQLVEAFASAQSTRRGGKEPV